MHDTLDASDSAVQQTVLANSHVLYLIKGTSMYVNW